VHSAYAALALICVALWGYASWSTMGLTLPSDLFPQDVVATVTGLSGLAAGLVGAVFTMAVGMLVDRFFLRACISGCGIATPLRNPHASVPGPRPGNARHLSSRELCFPSFAGKGALVQIARSSGLE